MKNLAVSRRYAKALLLIGKENGSAENYREELDNVTKVIASNKSLEMAITNPLYETSMRKKVLKQVIDKMELSDVMKSFLLLLFDKGRIKFLENIKDYYHKFADELKGIVRGTIVSATSLSSESIDKIRQALSKMTKKDVILEVEEDSSLIGGIITRIGDHVLDGSIRTQLINMRESLKKGESV